MEDTVVAALNLARAETQPSRRGQHQGDPGASSTLPRIAPADLIILKERFPHLADFSDEFLQERTTDELLRIESTSMKLKDAERCRDVEDRLHANKSALATKLTTVAEGTDNRWSILHPARFLGGAACSAQQLWPTARAVIGLTGHPPLSNYDLTSVGLGGFVTSKGWLELGNPSSVKISLKLFNINNCRARASNSRAASMTPDDFAEVRDLGEFKLALRALRTAAQFVCPWNMSFLALEGFLTQTDYCRAELAHDDRPALTLTQFVDFILQTNADRWRDSLGFLSTGELTAYWASFYGARPKGRSAASERDPRRHSHLGSHSHSTDFSGSARASASIGEKKKRVRFPWVDICHPWNTGRCTKAAGSCVSSRGVPLRHVCDWRDLANPTAVCGLDHQRVQIH
jgi:hypothetical protein